MPIKFSCPHCRRMLSVKEELGGRRGSCPGCKKMVTIPASTTTPLPTAAGKPSTPAASKKSDPDLESLAASLLNDSKQHAPAITSTIDFTCPYCDMELHLSSELAGKQSPCPECRRIIKVPALAKSGPLDWTKAAAARTPQGAKIDTSGMESAWGTQTDRGAASREALVEAGVIREDEVSPARKWTIRGIAAALLLILAGGGLWAWFHFRSTNLEQDGVAQAESWLKNQSGEHPPMYRAEMCRSLAEYYLRSGKKDSQGRDGANWLKVARDNLSAIGDPEEKLAVARALFDLQIEYHLWDDFGPTLAMISDRRTRQELIRDYGKRLIAAGEGERLERMVKAAVPGVVPAVQSVPPDAERPPPSTEDYSEQIACLAEVGLEYHRAAQADKARGILEQCRKNQNPQHDYAPAFIALLQLLGEKEPEGPKKDNAAAYKSFQTALTAGRLEAHLRGGKFEEAGKQLKELEANDRQAFLDACLLFAEFRIGPQRGNNDLRIANPADEPVTAVRAILPTFDPATVVGQRRRLAELCLAAGHGDTLNRLMEQKGFLSESVQDRVRVALLRKELGEASGAVDAAAALAPFKEGSLGAALAAEVLARHNARFDARTAGDWAAGRADTTEKAFAGLGVSIGMQGKK